MGNDTQQINMKKKLISLSTGELVSVFLFWMLMLEMKITSFAVLYNLFVNSMVLIQGAFFWFLLLRGKGRIEKPVRMVYQAFQIVDVLFLLSGVGVILFAAHRTGEKIGGLFWLLFALVEYINYFQIRLSYSGVELLLRLKEKRLQRSRIAKELKR